MAQIYNRGKKEYYEEKVYGGSLLSFLYSNVIGALILKHIVSKPGFSKFAFLYYDSRFSKSKIEKFIKEYDVPMDEFQKKHYKNFQQFFIRKLRTRKLRAFAKDNKVLCAPADSKLRVYSIENNKTILIKGQEYSLFELLGEEYNGFEDGICCVFRLSVDDYHHYAHFDNGMLKEQKEILGSLHTVSEFAQTKLKVYSKNHRIVSILQTENFGEVAYIEVGALLVGKINNKNKQLFLRGDEKGYFNFGGSTVILIFPKDTVCFDKDIKKLLDDKIEIKVKMGEKIGIKNIGKN